MRSSDYVLVLSPEVSLRVVFGRRVGFITVMEAVVIVFHLHEWSGKQWRRKFGDDKHTDLTQIIINNNLAS